MNSEQTVQKGRENVPSDTQKEQRIDVEAGILKTLERPPQTVKEGKAIWVLGELLFKLYGFSNGTIRAIIRKILIRFEGGPLFSINIRRIFSVYHKVEVGMYSGRGCFIPINFRAGTRIGRYCTIYSTAQAFSGNHPMNLKSMNAVFYNPSLGFVESDLITRTELSIGNDVFIGHNAVILPPVSLIGDGAVIGAGSIVHQDVPPYAVLVGNPARIVRYRFSKATIQDLLDSRWWDKSLEELIPEIESFRYPIEDEDKIR